MKVSKGLRTIIVVRHGDYQRIVTKTGDGPLSAEGRQVVSETADRLASELDGINQIDLAVVSGSIRCADTFSHVCSRFVEAGLMIGALDMRPELFCTSWGLLYAGDRSADFFADLKKLGEREAVMKYVPHLVNQCVERTLDAIPPAAAVVLVVTHGPHDALIAERLTGRPHEEGLGKGEGRIIVLP